MDSNEYSAPDKGEHEQDAGESAIRNAQNIPVNVK